MGEEDSVAKRVVKKKKKKQLSDNIPQPEEEDAVPEPEPVENKEQRNLAEKDTPQKDDIPKEPKTTKNAADKVKPKPAKKEPLEEGTFEKPALRKAKTVKREIEEPKLEKVTLKAHAFEKD